MGWTGRQTDRHHASDHRGRRAQDRQTARDLAQNLVPEGKSVQAIDIAEPVDVQDQHTNRPLTSIAPPSAQAAAT